MAHKLSKITLAVLSATTLSLTATTNAQESQQELNEDVEVIEVSGIRASLASAMNEKRFKNNLVEVIEAEDIGKLPDQNLAEVLENITGIQITREAGVGTGVQIRGTDANRTEINGVSTVGSGAGRSGIDFEDVSAAIIAGLEVTKSPDAKTIEGSVGGTINLKTIRPLQLNEQLAAFRVQGENSSLTTDSNFQPRISGTFGDNWDTDHGTIGIVISGSYAEQDVTAFRPRADRDNIITSDSGVASAQSFDFLPIQFFVQDYDNFEYETKNLVGTIEWAPNDNTKFFFDAIINDQERLQESSRVQASGVSALNDVSVPDEFETINFGSLGGTNLGSIQAALRGVIPVDLENDDDDPNLRFSSDTNSRVTKSEIFRLGGEWQGEKWSVFAEVASTSSDTTTPSFNTTLNFINPNAPLDAGGANDNAVPFAYDLSGGALTFGIADGAEYAPTAEQLLDPNNVVLRDVNIGRDTTENFEDAFRVDFTYYVDTMITSVDFGYRYNKSGSKREEIGNNVNLRSMEDSPRGSLFSELLVAGPDNFNDADGRELYVADFLLIDPEQVSSNPDAVLAALQQALETHGSGETLDEPTSSSTGFFDIEEETHALYAQANFEYEMFRGNFGVRYLQTDVTSVGNSVTVDENGDELVSRVTNNGDYDFILPRFNLVADVTDDIVLRFGAGKDIRRPNFNDLSTSVTFSTSPNPNVAIGNPNLTPEEVISYDLAAEWYFAEASVISVGIFHKTRKDLFVDQIVSAAEDPVTGYRDLTDPCEGGGIFNPIADINVFGPNLGTGVCVGTETKINDTGETTQKGIEFAVQYDLSGFESELGWASGFGVLANYTIQEFDGGEAENIATSRAGQVFAATTGSDQEVSAVQGLLNLSENAYNITLYYEKFGLSARMRYTWREAYRTDDFGSTSSFPWGFPAVQADRGQLNASVTYDVNENLNIGVEAVNITESEVEQYCVNEGALLCFQGLTDRRITLGANYRF
ncbi:TonB-dependent receptor [Alteromonas macleodii]|jgi:TonB-dependent receptor|uniref:TonB-dependent receptor n=1 Tax=Alteromonas TaxID=226 RepID=UPI000C784D41|nr:MULTISPECIES: TonB-dependent receptor [Alteromonas]AUI81571.1 TonB-dependent receptor [Alteromonas macleodii]MCH2257107.1 TonB-dependent receptor [Alteromonas sp.]PXW74664.1 TonB-dependent receptor [Alteromonas sp. I10]USI29570.1 TonB-dependent receptor [Alteromonas macleodii]|tara:strand:- start:19702 stop:22656 length:2955 start_codon:yes stop_codon:yes gene_type:complete